MKYTVLDYLEETANKYPDKTAFADVNSSVTWKDFVAHAKQKSTVIQKYFEPGTAVPVMAEKSVETLEYFFGALYAGCFYSYFDATFPDSRIESMIQTLNVSHIICDKRFEKKLSVQKNQPHYIQELQNEAVEYSPLRRNSIIDTDCVYANFTSGSTGTPKAVVVSHRCVIDFITCFTETFDITSKENIANQAPFDFDVSVKDIFSAVFTGATVHLVPKMFFSFPTKLLDYLVEREITTLIWAVSALCIISSLDGFSYKVPSKLNKIMFSGEVMPVKHLHIWQKFIPEATYINLYGPTEITCNCTYHIIKEHIPEDGIIPMGIPFKNERVFLLDENDKLILEPGINGEVCVSGTCVVPGYYNNWDKTNSVFIQNPLETKRFERIYRTGDLAKYGTDGLLYYVGRKDFQIKLNGHRIELSEVEGAIMNIPEINRVCCIFADNKVTAFYSGQEKDKKDIVAALRSTLPAFMIPSDFIFVKEFVLNKNGKIDRKVLEGMLNA
ncbi:MAG: amino acid adenylation domain-containing protein [Spirochaetia bacterium]|nr:amino acid adenylation domain-containing protein [Spirochaetia bacterium]MDY5886639.1 amino acid adenylation domain-containing protein [Treponema sp.]